MTVDPSSSALHLDTTGYDLDHARRRTRLLSWVLLLSFPTGLLCATVQLLIKPDFLGSFLIIAGAVVCTVIAWFTLRAGHYRAAAIHAVLIPSLFSFASIWYDPGEFMAFAYPMLAVVLSGVFLSLEWTVGVAVFNLAGLLVVPALHPEVTYQMVASAVGFNTIVPILVVGIQTTRNRHDAERQAALQRSAEQWRAFVEHHPEPITVAVKGVYVYVNAATVALFGAEDASQVVGRTPLDFTDPRQHDEIRERSQAVLELQATPPRQFHVRRLDGAARWIEASSVPIDYEGEVAVQTVLRNVTEQRQAKRALKRSEERYRALVHHAPEAICVVDMGLGRFVECNSNAESLFGLEETDLSTADPVMLSPLRQPDGELSEKAWSRHAMRAVGGEVCEFEWTYLARCGREVPCEVRLVRLPSDDSVLIRVSFTDITERIRAARALRASEERYRTLVETMNDGVAIVDMDVGISFVNERLSDMWGYPESVLVGRPLWDFLPPDQREVIEEQVATRAKGLPRQPYELTILHGGGGTIQVRVSPSPIYSANGELIGSFGVITEITEQKLAEKALQESEARFRSLIENALDLITVVDDHGTIVFQSPSLRRILGYAPEEVIGQDVRELVHPEDEAKAAAALLEGDGFAETRRMEFRVRHKDGTWRLLEAFGKEVVHQPSGGRLVLNARDITERRRLEREIQEVSGREQRRLGQDLHDGMGQILVGARLYTTALGRQFKDHEVADSLAEIGRMLDEAHTAARALARGLSPVSLEDGGLEAGLRDLARSTERVHDVSCIVECPRPVPIHDLEVATQVYRIAQEAVSNAAKHGGARTLRMRLDQDGGTATLTVVDDGRGFDETEFNGSGMGLRIMRHRAGMISGSIDIGPHTPRGTRVHCQFPNPGDGMAFRTLDWSEEVGPEPRVTPPPTDEAIVAQGRPQ